MSESGGGESGFAIGVVVGKNVVHIDRGGAGRHGVIHRIREFGQSQYISLCVGEATATCSVGI